MSVSEHAEPIVPALVLPHEDSDHCGKTEATDIWHGKDDIRARPRSVTFLEVTAQVPSRDPSPARSTSSYGGDDSYTLADDHDDIGHHLGKWLRGLKRHCKDFLHHHASHGRFETSLADQLVSENLGVNKDEFIPRGRLKDLLCETNVTMELMHHGQSRSPRSWRNALHMAKAICRRDGQPGLRNIFATLLLIGYPTLIEHFIDEGINDDDLPLVKKEDAVSGKPCLHMCDGIGEPGRKVQFSDKWRPHQVGLFARSQWQVLAPFFSQSKHGEHGFREFPDDLILPFTALESMRAGAHGHADIFHGEIHPQHHDFPVGHFVVKSIRIQGPDADQLEKEVRMLRRVCANEHIVDLFEAYQHRGAYHLLLPRARCDLEVYWKEVDHGGLNADTSSLLSWMAEQCEGLASGLNQVHHHLTTSMSSLFQRIPPERRSLRASLQKAVLPSPDPNAPKRHKFHGAHGDVKPSNILWFPGPTANGTLKITDFGTGEYSDTESTRRLSDSVPFTPSYQPPERALDIDDEVDVSWAYDVWMLGCVYSEFATWCVGGYPMVDEFTSSRRRAHADRGRGAPFFEVEANGKAVVKPAVEEVTWTP